MTVQEMLRTHEGQLEVGLLAEAIESALDCAAHCDSCADACLEEGDPALARCIRSDLDCATICRATASVLARAGRSGAPWKELVEVCRQACANCAEECEQHDHEHCQVCAQACRRCEEACRRLVASV